MSKTAQKLSKKANADLEACFREAKQMVDDNRLQEAKNLCEKLLATYGDSKDILNLMGVIHYRGGDPNTAIAYFKRLLDADPANTEALWNLANLLMNLGYRPQALEMYESILTHDPEHFMALKQLNTLYAANNLWLNVFQTGRKLVKHQPWLLDVWHYMNQAADHVPVQYFTSELSQELEDMLRKPSNHTMPILSMAAKLLCRTNIKFDYCIASINRGEYEAIESIPTKDLAKVIDIPLLHVMLRNYVFPHPSVERLLMLIRKRIISLPDDDFLEFFFPILITLASQCFVNEYIYFQTDEEKQRVIEIKSYIESAEVNHDIEWLCKLLLFGCYMPLTSLKNIEAIVEVVKKHNDTGLRSYITVSAKEILEEKAIIPSIPSIGRIEDDVSKLVQDQYEENPYPRWIDYGNFPSDTMENVLRLLFPFFDKTKVELVDRPEILIAGCGTGKHAVGVARRFANSRVLAVDLSRSSLAYAIRKCKEYGFDNIDYYQSDILNLRELNRAFDVVESVGVLHHMRDPMEGWKVITDLLKPGGIMKIGLYSSTARKAITEVRKRIKAEGYSDSKDDIRRFRNDLMQYADMKEKYKFTECIDFYSLSECRDLLFHRQEHCTSIPEIRKNLDELGLHFIGWEIAEPSVIIEYLKRFPNDRHFCNLDNWHEHEQEFPHIFFSMYQFWCYKPL